MRLLFKIFAVAAGLSRESRAAMTPSLQLSTQADICPHNQLPRLFLEQNLCPASQIPPLRAHQDKHDTPRINTHGCSGRYCVYTDTQFWGGRGISLVTTAETFDTAVLKALKRSYQHPEFITQVATDAFEEHEIPGKGIGLVAKRILRRGELLISEPPSLLVHLNMRANVTDKKRMEMQRAAVNALPLRARSETLELMGHFGGDPIEDRLDTNSFAVTLAKWLDHHALFTQTSVSDFNIVAY